MAKHGNKLPLRRQRTGVEDALLIRSAESLGRMIGSLQRQLDGASKKLADAGALRIFGTNGHKPEPALRGAAKAADAARKTSGAAGRAKGASKSGPTNVQSTVDPKSKRAAKSTTARKTAGPARSGASRKSGAGRKGSPGGRGAR